MTFAKLFFGQVVARGAVISGDEPGTLQRGRHARRRWRTSPIGSPLRAGRRARGSVRAEVRFPRDVELVVLVANDTEAES
jgi:hypothetical protein